MPTYTFTVTEKLTRQATVEVEAPNEEAAHQAALDEVADLTDDDWFEADHQGFDLFLESVDGDEEDEDVPEDFPVKPLGPNDPARDRVTCGTCGRSWDDAIPTTYTPAPAARCPFEHWH